MQNKHLTKNQWAQVVLTYEISGIKAAEKLYWKLKPNKCYKNERKYSLKHRILQKCKLWENIGEQSLERKPNRMKRRKNDNSDIPALIDRMNEAQKRQIIEDWIKEQRKKKAKAKINKMKKFDAFTLSFKSQILNFHRTSAYKKQRARKYKWGYIKSELIEIFNENKQIYGSRKLAKCLSSSISDRTLRNYMRRWKIATKTRQAKKYRESKNVRVSYKDLVKRNFNPVVNNILATDVTYIPALNKGNHVYLSAVINHKTKFIEAYELSRKNDTKLVLDTYSKINRENLIIHSDHGTTYSSYDVKQYCDKRNWKISMSRVGNTLDNREIEYFFSCLKGEFLNHIKTAKMKFKQIKRLVGEYILWYNSKRIQKRLNWKSPHMIANLI